MLPAMITIELKGLRFFAHHGWQEEEALVGAEFDVSLQAVFPVTNSINTIDDTVDYTKMYDLVKAIFSQKEKLLETVAQKITAAFLAQFKEVQNLQITITKLNPPIASFTGTVGIIYSTDFRKSNLTFNSDRAQTMQG